MTMMSAFDSVVNDQGLVQESQAADLIPGGSYPATLVKVEDRTASQNETFNDGKPNPLYGKPLANLQVKLEGVSAKGFDELDGKPRTHFIKLCPALVYDANKKLMTARDLVAWQGRTLKVIACPSTLLHGFIFTVPKSRTSCSASCHPRP